VSGYGCERPELLVHAGKHNGIALNLISPNKLLVYVGSKDVASVNSSKEADELLIFCESVRGSLLLFFRSR
jgi:hypothetical protein